VVAFKTTGVVETGRIDPEWVKSKTSGDVKSTSQLMDSVNSISANVTDMTVEELLRKSEWHRNLKEEERQKIEKVMAAIINPNTYNFPDGRKGLDCDGFASLFEAWKGGVEDNPRYIGGDGKNPADIVPEKVKQKSNSSKSEEIEDSNGRTWITGKVSFETIKPDDEIFQFKIGDIDPKTGKPIGHVVVVAGTFIDENGRYTLRTIEANGKNHPGTVSITDIKSQAQYDQLFKNSAVLTVTEKETDLVAR
jgi:hypothetical protein